MLRLIAIAILMSASVFAQASEAAAVQAKVDAFHAGWKKGDAAAVMRLIAPDAIMLEGGNIETREQYEKNHLPADIEFETAVTSVYKPVKVTISGNTAWAISNGELSGSFQGDPVSLRVVELMVFTKEPSGWIIRSIHWSSKRR